MPKAAATAASPAPQPTKLRFIARPPRRRTIGGRVCSGWVHARVKDDPIDSFRVLDNFSRNRGYFSARWNERRCGLASKSLTCVAASLRAETRESLAGIRGAIRPWDVRRNDPRISAGRQMQDAV